MDIGYVHSEVFSLEYELVALTKELTDMLRKDRTIDWQKKESARAGMRKMVKRLLKKYKYPPEGMADAVQLVMMQCEMWTDNFEVNQMERMQKYYSGIAENYVGVKSELK